MSSVASPSRGSGKLAALSGVAIALLGSASILSSASPAAAQYYYSYGTYGSPGGFGKPRPVKRAKKQRPAERESVSRSPEAQPTQRSGPLVLVISIKRQRVSIYDANGLITDAPISSGRVGYSTPQGVFTILEKNKVHFSNLYDSAPMPNMQRITWSGVALHAGDLPGYPASHGCIRLPRGFSSKLFEMTRLGDRVIVTGDQPAPQRLAHDKLFAAFPSETTITTGAILPNERAKVADASGTAVPSTPEGAASDTKPVTTVRISPFREAWLAEMARREAAVGAAARDKAETVTKAAEAKVAIEAAKTAAKTADKTSADFAAAARKAREAKTEADRKLADFAKNQTRAIERQTARAYEPAELNKVAETEDALEKATFDRAADLETAAEDAARAAADAKAAEDKVAEAVKAHAALVADLKSKDTALASAIAANEAAKRREAKRNHPISVLVSRKEQKIFVRQGYEPLLELPVGIANPDQPIGTHIFTAHAIKEDRRSIDWTVVTLSPPARLAELGEPDRSRKKKDTDAVEQPLVVGGGPSAADALDRVSIPDEVRAMVEDAMKPGSSLIISDLGIGNETGKFTDFILQTSPGGSGGGKKKQTSRPRPSSKPARGPSNGPGPFFW